MNLKDLSVSETCCILSYDLNDLIAEKIRSLIQQVFRKRYRRQDVYDLNILIKEGGVDKAIVLQSLIEKSNAREIKVTEESLNDKEVKMRAQRDYPTLHDEIQGKLPDFEESYQRVLGFYKSLPW